MRSIEFLAFSIISGGLVTEQGAIRNSVFFISVKSVFDKIGSIEIIENPVSILFEPSSKDDKLVVFGHLLNEGQGMRSCFIVPSSLVKMYQSLVQVKN